jgi:tetratricopeptide (TPR) repeat protein
VRALAVLLFVSACGAGVGRRADYPRVSPQSYEHYLRGRLAAERGDHADAAAHFRIAIQASPDEPELRLALAEELVADSNLPEAAGEVRAFVERWPEDPDGWELLGRVASLRRDPQGAAQAYQKSVELGPWEDRRWLLLAGAQRMAGEVVVARKTYLDAAARFPDSPEAQVRLGKLELELGHLPLAERALVRAVALDADRVDARVLLAETHRQAGRPDLASAALREAFTRSDGDPDVGERLFHTLLDSGDRAGAIALLDGLEREVSEPAVQLQVGQLYLVLHRADDAQRVAAALLTDDPASQSARLLRVRALELKGDKAGALAEALLVPAGDDNYVGARALAGLLAARLGRPQDGLGHVDAGLAARPGSSTLVAVRANLLDRLGRRDEARRDLDRALGDRPEDEELVYARARLELRAGAPDRAVAVMETHLENSHDSVLALNFIGFSWAERGIRLADAERLLRRAMNLRPHDGYVLDSFGVLMTQIGKLDDARALLERADRLVPFEPEILLHLGDLYLKAGDPNRARATFHQALALDPDDDVKLKLEERLRVSAARGPAPPAKEPR